MQVIFVPTGNRLRKVLSRIISKEQKGFLEGRSIADCSRLMFDIIHSCECINIDGLILLVDFEKAFDSLSWEFIQKSHLLYILYL